MAYRLVLPPELSRIHPVFHVSILRKYIADPSHVLQLQAVELSEDLTYDEFSSRGSGSTNSSTSHQRYSDGESFVE